MRTLTLMKKAEEVAISFEILRYLDPVANSRQSLFDQFNLELIATQAISDLDRGFLMIFSAMNCRHIWGNDTPYTYRMKFPDGTETVMNTELDEPPPHNHIPNSVTWDSDEMDFVINLVDAPSA